MGRKVVLSFKKTIEKRDISLRELGRIADIRHAALIELTNKKRQSMNFGHIERIADSLNIDDIREILELENKEE
ncbi:helix-turn-helix domain-containing protein [Cytobacillus sp. NCCP-133]|uniref:helix-turn-helix domain-containing protein n=1 Tax=Cytobacillus sp. NCCP-133 TaxID=766848 RepID=UPI0022324E07|nr:helix-turn-helix transcriptional regulator [Cytobacillus sp. NCCP-133]GLB61872.1 transcriptional regulator [Cytobacillus sp. NCCP-133]